MISAADIEKAEAALLWSVADVRAGILGALRENEPGPGSRAGYLNAVIAVCDLIEADASLEELCHTRVDPAALTPQHRIGEHLAATRRFFGLIP